MEIQLFKSSLCFTIDAEDLDKILAHNARWYLSLSSNGKPRRIHGWSKKLHRGISLGEAIIGRKSGLEIDHINRNPLDNRKINLRLVTKRENNLNRNLKDGKLNRGVCKNRNIWCVAINYLDKDGLKQTYRRYGFKDEISAKMHADECYKKLYGHTDLATNN